MEETEKSQENANPDGNNEAGDDEIGHCDLVSFKGSSFMNSARVHTGFSGDIAKINEFASTCGVKVYVTSSFRKYGQPIEGAIVKPERYSNHYVGHAIDMNLVENGYWCNSRCLRYELDQHEGVKCFITKIRADPTLRWGGDFSQRDEVHIDDGVNLRKPNYYNRLYNRLQKDCN